MRKKMDWSTQIIERSPRWAEAHTRKAGCIAIAQISAVCMRNSFCNTTRRDRLVKMLHVAT